jgi:hypothetical protein
MGCSPSQAVIVQSTKTENSHLHPTIFMVGEKSLQMLRELGELKFYQLAQHSETENTLTENPHNDFAAQLENPLQYLRDEESKSSGNHQVTERSVCKIKSDYLIHAQKHEPGLNNDGVNDLESSVGFNHLLGNLSSDSVNQISTRNASDSPILLSPNSLSHSSGMDIKITAKNTSSSPILLSGISPSHSGGKGIKITAQNLSSSPTHDKTKTALSPNSLHRELNLEINDNASTTSTASSANDPLDEIVSVPDASSTTLAPTSANEGNVTPKTKTKMFFGRNRVMPKRDVSDKYDVRTSEHEQAFSRTVDDS